MKIYLIIEAQVHYRIQADELSKYFKLPVLVLLAAMMELGRRDHVCCSARAAASRRRSATRPATA